MSTTRLSARSAAFFDLLSEVVFTNPFGVEREEVERLASASTRIAPPRAGEHHFMALVPAVDDELERLAADGVRRLDDVPTQERERLRHAFLFRSYHRQVARFDAVIKAQLAEPTLSVQIDFGDEALSELSAVGFRPDEAAHYFALFYQLRRAYYFIARALVGESASMRTLREGLWSNVFSEDVRVYDRILWARMEDFSTLLLGETGTGKGAAAEAMGRSGHIPYDVRRRRFAASFNDAFVATNLSSYPASLIESVLFGHRKGAFTGAVDDHEGLFSRCREHGTLFLDEIGDLSADIQLKLLTVLQDRRFTPVGSHATRRFSGRVVAATNRPLAELRESGCFRDDFYYRLSSDVITVPALRTRLLESPDELDRLVRLLVGRLLGSREEELTQHVISVLHRDLPRDYRWPGNVRELEQAVRRILLRHRYVGEELPRGQDELSQLAAELMHGELTAAQLMSRYCRLLYERLGTYEAVAGRVGLDRRTVRRHVAGGR